MDGELPLNVQSYRVFTYDWTGSRLSRRRSQCAPTPAGGAIVYVSWNGATEVQRWTVLAGGSLA